MDTKQATLVYLKERKEESERIFQVQVDGVLKEISEYSQLLKNAKRRLLELEYKEPGELDLE